MAIHSREFGKTQDGTIVTLFELTNQHGNIVRLTNYGAILTSVEVPDRQGRRANINLGFDNLDEYLRGHPYFGSTVGRFCNRIAGGKFALDGKTYSLAVNNGPNHLHGGIVGFDKRIWEAETIDSDSQQGVRFTLLSPDGEEGFPGNLQVVAEYSWNDANELSYAFRASTDQPTVLNLTNHAYWNLAGVEHASIGRHVLQLDCNQFLAVDDSLIPTGDFANVEGTPLDFRQPHAIGARLSELPATNGYDHCYVVLGTAGQLRRCAQVFEPSSGRSMEVLTTQPGVQLYTGNHLGGKFPAHSAFCLETQHFPDSPNKSQFPSTRLDPDQPFYEATVHRFSTT
jgi:aldose 1-epimerase